MLVPFIRHYFPETTVVPIILQKNIRLDELFTLKRIISKFLRDPKSLVLLSMDFSHNQTSDEADRRDELAKSVIQNLDYKKTDVLDIDCHPGLKILLAALSESKGIRVRFLSHSNSAKITGRMDITNVTSYHTVLFYQEGFTDLKHDASYNK